MRPVPEATGESQVMKRIMTGAAVPAGDPLTASLPHRAPAPLHLVKRLIAVRVAA
jgi:hypothetical protein